jgi:hypothetical protein
VNEALRCEQPSTGSRGCRVARREPLLRHYRDVDGYFRLGAVGATRRARSIIKVAKIDPRKFEIEMSGQTMIKCSGA